MDYNKSKEALDVAKQVFESKMLNFTEAQHKRYSSHIIASREIISVAFSIQEILEEFNNIKLKLDAAHKAQDADKFDEHLSAINKLLIRADFSNLSLRVNRRKKWLIVVSELRKVVVRQLNFMRATRDGGKKAAKYMRMSPKQLEAAKNASIRQKISWGM